MDVIGSCDLCYRAATVNWPESMQQRVPDFSSFEIDEEEL